MESASPWYTTIMLLATVAGSATINLLIVGYYVGKYRMVVEQCQKDSQEARDEALRLGRQLAAFTGIANGTHYREGD
jgi:hypothetical protein